MPAQLEVSVLPNSGRFAIGRKDGKLKIWLTSEAERGKANAELVRELSSALGCEVRIARGHAGRRKTLSVGCDEGALEEKLAALLR